MKAKRHYHLPSGKELIIGERTIVMGILNVTADSFSDGGKWNSLDKALSHALSMVEAGAAIIDIGAESSRPGFVPVSPAEEIARLSPFMAYLAPKIPVPISIDTFKAETARVAVQLGADILNDIWGLQYEKEERGAMARVAAEVNAPVIVMHNCFHGEGQKDIITSIQEFFQKSRAIARETGIPKEQLIFDPGIGFGKTAAENIEVLHRLHELCTLDGDPYPLLLGVSRKSFIGYALNLPLTERLEATGAAVVLGIASGASIVRVHDVKEIKRMCLMADIILEGKKHGSD